MKWVAVGFIVCLATLCRGNAIREASKSEDAAPSKDNAQIDFKKASSIIRIAVTSEAECLAGSEWESNCHRCRCSEEGHAECTKLEACTGRHGAPSTCKPHTSFKRDCNTCTCLENGLALCTLRGCVHLPALPVFKKVKLESGVECLPKSSWMSKCNSCTCTEDGHPTCTEMACLGYENEPEMTCAPDTTWKYECNTCSCSPDGTAMCTRMGCGIFNINNFNPTDDEDDKDAQQNVSLNRRIRAATQVKTCQPNQEFRMDCNKCLCNDEGRDFSCTRNDCAALNTNGNGGLRSKRDLTTQVETQCEPGSVFYQGCNLCRCTEDGDHATCALKRCTDKNQEENNVPESDPSFRCNPGEQSKRDCNDCSCSADGKSVFCTLRLCDQDITPTI